MSSASGNGIRRCPRQSDDRSSKTTNSQSAMALVDEAQAGRCRPAMGRVWKRPWSAQHPAGCARSAARRPSFGRVRGRTSSARSRPDIPRRGKPARTRPLPAAGPPRARCMIPWSAPMPSATRCTYLGPRCGLEPQDLVWSLWPQPNVVSGGLPLGQRSGKRAFPGRGRG